MSSAAPNTVRPAVLGIFSEGKSTMKKHVWVEREIGGRRFRLETGKIAKLASGAVLASYDDTSVLVTAMRADPRPGLDFFPLQCDYREKYGAAGKFPGGFRKREGPPNEKEILTMRNMDRPIRPLFPDGFIDEIQIQAWVMSHDTQNDSDVVACNGASAALCLTDAPFEGPVATVRVGRIETEEGLQFVLNPTHAQLEFSDLDLVLAGHADGDQHDRGRRCRGSGSGRSGGDPIRIRGRHQAAAGDAE